LRQVAPRLDEDNRPAKERSAREVGSSVGARRSNASALLRGRKQSGRPRSGGRGELGAHRAISLITRSSVSLRLRVVSESASISRATRSVPRTDL
jgi:hypothetical protein